MEAFVTPSRTTTRFANEYQPDGTRRQFVLARATDVELSAVSESWRAPDVLLLSPVIGEVPSGTAQGFQAEVVGAIAQGWLRDRAPDGAVMPRVWDTAARDLAGVHVLFLSHHDLPDALSGGAAALLAHVPVVVVTRGWKGSLVLTRDSVVEVPTLPRAEVDPTGAGDVFAASFLLRYHEAGDLADAAAFAGCAASCAVEGVGTSTLGDRAEIEWRLQQRERLIEEGEWDE